VFAVYFDLRAGEAGIMNLNMKRPPSRLLIDWLEKKGIPWTWDNWLRLAYGDDALIDPPEQLLGAEAFAEVPQEFQADIELFLMKHSGSMQ
jgi:hypothetical protein